MLSLVISSSAASPLSSHDTLDETSTSSSKASGACETMKASRALVKAARPPAAIAAAHGWSVRTSAK